MAFGKAPKDPFGTAVGSLVDRATLGSLQTEDWGQFMHICDLINATEEGPKDAVKALKKKLSKNCNHKEIRLTLSTWARGFPGPVDVSEVKEVYLELLKKGVEFPSSDTSRGEPKTSSQPSTKSSPSSANAPKQPLLPLPTGPTLLLTPDQIGKLYSELDMAKTNVRVMSSILRENVPGSENPDDMNLLQKLYKTCRMMQERIMDLLATVENEDVIVELIQVNEDLNDVLLGHERFSRNRVRFLENQRIQREREELATVLSPVPLNPGQTTPSNGLSAAAASKNKAQSPHYYEIMEFDPLAPTDESDYVQRYLIKKCIITDTS
ncbi:target of myb1 (chicken)-like 1 [Amazona aestiva]|uniref:Target of myb1 (Chicken)-like 1 n=1 Tax=Amazona aestiva TaxID=12930 RepID=A0A0Q3PKV4_AMAAE|nr:target of myb1 (chicken)-like 1 [Amazona aestiva]